MPAAICAAFVAGLLVLQQQAALPGWPTILALAALALATCLLLALRAWRAAGAAPDGHDRAHWVARGLLLAAAVALGLTYAAAVAQWRLADQLDFADEGRDLRVTGLIASLPAQLERGTRFEFEVEDAQPAGVHVPARIALSWYSADASVRPGERWSFTVRLRRPHGGMNPGGFDLEAWMLERSLRATGYVRTGRIDSAPERLAPMVWQLPLAVDRARHALRERLQQRLQGERYGGVLIALVLGDQRAIGEEDWLLFNRTGISHLVSISGLHITMIAGLVAAAVSLLWRRSARLLAQAPTQTAAAVAAMLAAFLYCLLAGWGVPAQRTFFMLATVAVVMLWRSSPGAASSLALAAALVGLLDPWAVTAPGFWLSFGAVAAILWVMVGRARLPAARWPARLREAARVQLAVTLALVPLTVALFQQVSLVSPLANALAIPLVSLIVTPLALTGGLFAALPEPLGAFAVPALALAHWLFDLLAALLGWLVQLPLASVALPAPPAWTVLLAVLGAGWLLAPPGWPLRWLGFTWLVPLMVWPSARPAEGEMWVTALDVGQGMAVLVETAQATLLYDSGPRYTEQADAGGRVILPYLRWRGIRQLDYLVVSHLDSDHSGGAASILRGLPVARVFSSVDGAAAPLQAAPSVARCEAGQRADLGAAMLQVLHPTRSDYARPGMSTNALSCVIEITLAPHRVVLTGDIPAREEAQLVARGLRGPLTLVSAPHHGSRNSSSAAFVDSVAARWVLVQAGYRNRFGHPAADVVARYVQTAALVERTDAGGALQWRLQADGSVQVLAWRQHAARYWHNQPGRVADPQASAAVEDRDEPMPSAGPPLEPAAEPTPPF